MAFSRVSCDGIVPQVVFHVASFTERDMWGEASGRCSGPFLYLGSGMWLERFQLMLSKMVYVYAAFCKDT